MNQEDKRKEGWESAALAVRPFEPSDEKAVFALFEREGEEWKECWEEPGRTKYAKTMASSLNYVVIQEGMLCGYMRCHKDESYGIFVYDLLVDEAYRGKEYGKMLLQRAREDHPGQELYVLSDSDPYYEKLGFEKVGSIFLLRPEEKKLL